MDLCKHIALLVDVMGETGIVSTHILWYALRLKRLSALASFHAALELSSGRAMYCFWTAVVRVVHCAGSGTTGVSGGKGLQARGASGEDAPPLEVLFDRVKREPSPAEKAVAAAYAASAAVDTPVSSTGSSETGSSGGRSLISQSAASRNGSHPSVVDIEASLHSSSSSSTSSSNGSSSNKRHGGAVSNGAAPSRQQRDVGWWRKLPYVCVPVIHYLEEGAVGFVTAELASPGAYRAPHVLAFEVRPSRDAAMLHPCCRLCTNQPCSCPSLQFARRACGP